MTTTCHDHMKLSDHDHHQFQLLNEKNQKKSPIVSGHFLSYSNVQDQGSHHPRKAHQVKHQQEANNFATEGGSSSDHSSKKSTLWNNNNEQGNQMSGTRYQNIPTKWLPSKLRLVHRMMGSATDAQVNPHTKFKESPRKSSSSPEETTESCNNGSFSTPVTRVCSDCNTTKTPLWRSGPRGPKSLCNACGIRQRKARQALAAAASAANGTCLEVEGPRPSKPKVQEKDKRLKINIHITPYKKRSKIANNIGKKNKLCFEDLLISLSKNLAFHQIFPQDEKEAAILLMALSCGLVHG